MHHDFAMTGTVITPPESALKADWEKCRTATNNAHAELRKADGRGDDAVAAKWQAEYFRLVDVQKAAFKAYMEEP